LAPALPVLYEKSTEIALFSARKTNSISWNFNKNRQNVKFGMQAGGIPRVHQSDRLSPALSTIKPALKTLTTTSTTLPMEQGSLSPEKERVD
jgi:hypothetical protein